MSNNSRSSRRGTTTPDDDSNLLHWFDHNRFLAPLALTVVLLVLLISAMLIYRNVKQFAETARWISHSREVLTTTEGMLAEISEAESAGRGYFLTGKPTYRQQFDKAVAATQRRHADLQHLTVDHPHQQRRVRRLSQLIEPAIDLMQEFVAQHGVATPSDIEQSVMLDVAAAQMTEIRDLVQQIQTTEDELLVQRTDRYNQRLSETWWTVLTSTVFAAGSVLGTFFLLQRHWRLQRSSANQSRRHVREKDELARYNQRLLESTGEGIYGIDEQGRCTFMNRAGALILGGQPDEFLGQEMHSLVHHTTAKGEHYDREDCPIYKASQTGDGCRVDNELFWRLDGQSVPVEYSSFPIKDQDRVEGAVVTFNGIAARLRAQQELQRAKEAAEAANESKSQFLANMSHELRTPLNAVIMYSELLAEEAEDRGTPEFIPDLKRIRFAGKHLLELVNGVLDLSKVEAGKMELFSEPFDVSHLIEEVVATVEPLIEKNRNKLETQISDDVTQMQGDVTKIRQVLYNLLANASKFTEDGTITVGVARDSEEPGKIAFTVRDTGIGMTEQQVARLFQPFIQADASTTRKYGGTGLGLAIIKRFTELMQGSVTVDSVLHEGTTFTVTVPEKIASTAVSRTATGQSDENHPDGDTSSTPAIDAADESTMSVVLVIDDDPAIRDILSRVLVAERIRPITAADGADGLAKAREHRPDLIILDVTMPKVDGWSVLATLKADPQLADIPVIMQSVKDDRDLGFMLGASEYLVKPVDRDRLISMLRRYMQNDEGTILIVDDDEPTRRVIARTLTHQGWTVAHAGDGAEALQQIHLQVPVAILLDLMMPTMDGFEFLEVLHANPAWQAIPTVVLTAKELTAEDRQRLNGGVERVLAKGALNRHRFLDEVRRIVIGIARGRHPQPPSTNESPTTTVQG